MEVPVALEPAAALLSRHMQPVGHGDYTAEAQSQRRPCFRGTCSPSATVITPRRRSRTGWSWAYTHAALAYRCGALAKVYRFTTTWYVG